MNGERLGRRIDEPMTTCSLQQIDPRDISVEDLLLVELCDGGKHSLAVYGRDNG